MWELIFCLIHCIQTSENTPLNCITVIVIVIVTTGASCVDELLKVNNSLQELNMWHNPIGDDGMSSVTDGLQCNNTLTKLNVQSCGFSVKDTIVFKTEFKIILPIHCPVF